MTAYLKDLKRLCRATGWECKSNTGGGHIRLTRQGVEGYIVAANSPRDAVRTLRNTRALMARAEKFGTCNNPGGIQSADLLHSRNTHD
jgi:hypothetical protein